MSVYHPEQVTEREPDGVWEDCTWATGVMLRNAAAGKTAVPTGQAEYEALRVAGGGSPVEGTGSNFIQLAAGMRARYGVNPGLHSGLSFDEAWAYFTPGTAMGWQGSMGAVSDYLRRWDTAFRGAHAALAIRDDATDQVWWMNPLAPPTFPGEYISKATLRAYYESGPLGSAIIYMPIPASTGDAPMPGLVYNFRPGQTGVATINQDGVSMIVVATKGLAPVPKGQKRRVYAHIRLVPSLEEQLGWSGTSRRTDGLLVGEIEGTAPDSAGVQAAFLLDENATFVADSPQSDPKAAVNAALDAVASAIIAARPR